MKHKYFDCVCHHPDHILRVSYVEDKATQRALPDENIYLEIQLESGSFFKRLINATKYLFGHKVKDGMWTGAELDQKAVEGLHNLLEGYLLSFNVDKRLKAKIAQIKENSKN